MNVRTFVASTSFAALVLVVGCATTTEQYLGAERKSEPPPTFVVDAGTDATDSTFELTNYCPSNKCPANRTTCPSSQFPCDIDLKADPYNCGSCGFVCPQNANGALFACAEGKCQMTCTQDPQPRLDCNGVVDDGCEVTPNTNDNCGGCGIKCTDPANPCVETTSGYKCGCNASDILCTVNERLTCLDPRKDDTNCGACGNACDPTNGGAPAYPKGYYGCNNSECGHHKCNMFQADCNGKDEDGCETYTWDKNNCGGCGNVCPDGQGCYLLAPSLTPTCMCPLGKTLCLTAGILGTCVDADSDPKNCGGCGNVCPGVDGPAIYKTIYPICKFGTCETACKAGRANCNGNVEDGCEVNTDSDPHNCGECGHECNAVEGQACVLGRCAVEPCDVDAGVGEVTR